MPFIILITHQQVGPCLLNTAEAIIGAKTDDVACIEVPMDSDPQLAIDQVNDIIDAHDETLILTDLYGSTPGNITAQLTTTDSVSAVCGLNLPMLLRTLNYRSEPLPTLVKKAIEGARSGIKSC